MKKIISIFSSTIFLLYLLPLTLAMSLSPVDKPKQTAQIQNADTVISVLNKTSGKVEEYDIEEYLIGVVSAEMPASYQEEALKAQAVAARSYILSKKGNSNPDHKDADVCTNPSHCKAYLSEEEANKKWGNDWSAKYLSKIKSAVNATKGEYIAYDGEIAVACFCAASSGKTESAADVWGSDTPYLKSVESDGDLTYTTPSATVSVPISNFCQKLGISSGEIGEITRTDGGSIKTIVIGKKRFSGTKLREIFNLNSANFTLTVGENQATFVTKGKGHGVGMSQYGANKMAESGKNYTEILLHYYSNVTIEKL